MKTEILEQRLIVLEQRKVSLDTILKNLQDQMDIVFAKFNAEIADCQNEMQGNEYLIELIQKELRQVPVLTNHLNN